MPNNFEKQVKEKMDELTFVPTAPVWEQIQKQIRAKKDRRRILLWLPLLILVTGTGTWLLKYGQTNKAEHKTADIKMHQKKDVGAVPVPGKENLQVKEHRVIRQFSDDPVISNYNKSKKHTDRKTGRNNKTKEKGSAYNYGKGELNKDKFQEQPDDNLLKEQGINLMERKREQMLTVSYLPEHLLNHPLFIVLSDSVSARKVVADTSFIDSSLVKSKDIKGAHWQKGITASVGLSGISNSFDVFPASLQADAGAINGNYNGFRNVGSPVNKNIAYSIGAEARKELSSRFSFTIGIAYRYYSTSIKVGPERVQDTVLGSNKTINRFYLGYGPNLHNYSNQYYFISLPLSMQWKISADIPVYLEGSLSLNQMFYSNALIFDRRTGIYYSDKSVYNKTQLMTGLGVSYGLLRSSWFIGPQVQFGLRQMEKNGSSNHLVYAGLQARFFFKK
jgi:hypothetical protein